MLAIGLLIILVFGLLYFKYWSNQVTFWVFLTGVAIAAGGLPSPDWLSLSMQ